MENSAERRERTNTKQPPNEHACTKQSPKEHVWSRELLLYYVTRTEARGVRAAQPSNQKNGAAWALRNTATSVEEIGERRSCMDEPCNDVEVRTEPEPHMLLAQEQDCSRRGPSGSLKTV